MRRTLAILVATTAAALIAVLGVTAQPSGAVTTEAVASEPIWS